MATLYIVGIGPGGKGHMTLDAVDTIKKSKVLVGYTYYIELIDELISDQKIEKTGMKGEVERCKKAIEWVELGYDTAIISTGDAGLYGMAGLIYEMKPAVDIKVVPGITAAFAAASVVGAPIMHDFCTISLSDLLTPWKVIEKRLKLAAMGDFVITLYNPKSKGRPNHIVKAIEIISSFRMAETPVAVVEHAGRNGENSTIMSLGEMNYDVINMMTTVIIGNESTFVRDGKMITPRGYANSYEL